jgi:hypothetical protein
VGEEGGKTGEARRKNGETRRTKWDPRMAGGRPLVAGRPKACPTAASLFSIFFIFVFDFDFWPVLRNFLAFWENWCTTPPFFEACPYILKC